MLQQRIEIEEKLAALAKGLSNPPPQPLPSALANEAARPVKTSSKLIQGCLVTTLIMLAVCMILAGFALSGNRDTESNRAVMITAIVSALPIALFFWLFAYLWIWPLIDCLRHEPKMGNEKAVWTVIILFLNFMGGIAYLLARRSQRIYLYGE
jgi:hypothetical protein